MALTAWQALLQAKPQAGQRVLINAASGGVGHVAVQASLSAVGSCCWWGATKRLFGQGLASPPCNDSLPCCCNDSLPCCLLLLLPPVVALLTLWLHPAHNLWLRSWPRRWVCLWWASVGPRTWNLSRAWARMR